MQFTTHNNEAIPTMGLSKVGTVETTRRELTKLFGEPIGYNFVVKFSDGERVLVYPLKGDTYQVEGTSKNALNNLSIAIDLHRERGEEEKNKNDSKSEQVAQSIQDILQTLHETKGEAYVKAVETASLCVKLLHVMEMLTDRLVSIDEIPKRAAKQLDEVTKLIVSRIISIAADNYMKGDKKNRNEAEQIMEWALKIQEREGDMAEAMISEMDKDK